MKKNNFLDNFKLSPFFEIIGEAEIPECLGDMLLMDDPICLFLMHNEGMNYPVVEQIQRRQLNSRDGSIATRKARVFGFVAKCVVRLESLFTHDQTILQSVAISQNQLAMMFGHNACSTDVLACDIPGRKNITILRHGNRTYFLEVALYNSGFPAFRFLDSIEGQFLQPGEGFFFTLPSGE